MAGSLRSHGADLRAGIVLLGLSSAAVSLAQSGYVLIVVSDNSGSPVADAGTRRLIIFVPEVRGHFSASAGIPQHTGEAQALWAGNLFHPNKCTKDGWEDLPTENMPFSVCLCSESLNNSFRLDT